LYWREWSLAVCSSDLGFSVPDPWRWPDRSSTVQPRRLLTAHLTALFQAATQRRPMNRDPADPAPDDFVLLKRNISLLLLNTLLQDFASTRYIGPLTHVSRADALKNCV